MLNGYFGMREACELIGEPYHTVWFAMATHRIPPVARTGKNYLWTKREIDNARTFFETRKIANDDNRKRLENSAKSSSRLPVASLG